MTSLSPPAAEARPALMDVSIVIVNYKSRAALMECLAALEATRGQLMTEVVVVDNASGDGALAAIGQSYPGARGIANTDNVGYARAINQGIAASSGEFVVAMNPDCIVEPGALATMVVYLRTHPQTAVVGPKILNSDHSIEFSARSFPTHLTFLFNRYSLLTRLFPENPHTRRYLLTDWDHASARDVDWVSGACMMVRRAAIAGVGGMDEAFFMFNEDVDWCRRMKLAGWAVTCVPDAVVVHHIGASKSRVAPKVIVERHRGMIHYFHKHHPTNPMLAAAAAALIMLRAGLMLTANAFKPR
jgi:GT2 family glycosyltransferase